MKLTFLPLLSFLLMGSLSSRPVQIIEVFPPEQSTQTKVEDVGAALNFRLGEESVPSTLQLFIDGVDVTSSSTIGNTRDGCLKTGCPQPPSLAGISYSFNSFEPGIHRASIRFQMKDGEIRSYEWSFSIKLMGSLTPRPVQIIEVFPPEQSTQTKVEDVGAALNFRLGEESVPSTLQLFIDGVDVTSSSTIGSTRDGCLKCDEPPSRVDIYYPSSDYKPGIHRASIRFQMKDGEVKFYEWTFSVEAE